MMRAALVIASVLVAATDAGASIRLCIRHADEIVPIDPSFVVPLEDVDRFTAMESRTQTPLAVRITPIDHRWARVAVVAGDGTKLQVDHATRLRVSAGWKRSTAPLRVTATRFATEVQVEVAHDLGQLDGARIDWAFARADLVPGMQGTRIAGRRWCREDNVRVAITPAKDSGIIFLRITPLLLDGTDGAVWEGWLHPGDGVLRVEQGDPPRSRAPRPQCANATPRVTGEQPTFRYFDADRTFRATTLDGRNLPTSVHDDYDSTRVQVSALHGDVFRLEVLPPGAGCPLEVRVARQPPPSYTRVRDVGALEDTVMRLELVSSTSASYSVSDSSSFIAPTGNTLDVELWDQVWTSATQVGIEQTTGFLLSPVRDGFQGPACYVGIVRDVTTNIITPRKDRGPAGEPSCLAAY